MQQPGILVVGDVMLDHYLVGEVKRISPEAPVPVVNVTQERRVLGGSGNVAKNLANLGARTWLLGAIGQDESGTTVQHLCAEAGITPLLFEAPGRTTRKVRIIGEKQQIVRVDFEDKHTQHALTLARLDEALAAHAPRCVVTSDYGKGLCDALVCRRIIDYCQQHHVPNLIDPKGKNWEKYRGAYLLTPNLSELATVANEELSNQDDTAVAEAGERVRRQFGLQHLLVTRSEKGMSLLSTGSVRHFPTQEIEVFDVSGAGDTVVAVLAFALVSGKSLATAIRLANLAGGYVVTQLGTYAISRDELDALAKGHENNLSNP